jgi:hypothetical protein
MWSVVNATSTPFGIHTTRHSTGAMMRPLDPYGMTFQGPGFTLTDATNGATVDVDVGFSAARLGPDLTVALVSRSDGVYVVIAPVTDPVSTTAGTFTNASNQTVVMNGARVAPGATWSPGAPFVPVQINTTGGTVTYLARGQVLGVPGGIVVTRRPAGAGVQYDITRTARMLTITNESPVATRAVFPDGTWALVPARAVAFLPASPVGYATVDGPLVAHTGSVPLPGAGAAVGITPSTLSFTGTVVTNVSHMAALANGQPVMPALRTYLPTTTGPVHVVTPRATATVTETTDAVLVATPSTNLRTVRIK